MTIPILLLISILYLLNVYKVDCVYIGKMNRVEKMALNQLNSMKKTLNDKASSFKDSVKEKANSSLNSVKSALGIETKEKDNDDANANESDANANESDSDNESDGEKKSKKNSLEDITTEALKAGEDFSKSAINGAIEKIKIELEKELKNELDKKKSKFEQIILDKIDDRINASSIQNYLKQLNPSYVLPKPNVGGSSSKYIKRKRKTKKNPKRIQKKAKNKTKKRQQGGTLLKHAFVEYFSQPSKKIKETITSSLGETNLRQVLQSAITNVMISFPESPQNQTEIEDAMKGVMKRIFSKNTPEDIKKAILSEKCDTYIQ